MAHCANSETRGGYSHTLPKRVCAAHRGRDFRTGYLFQRRFLERGIIFRTHESSTFVSSHLKLFTNCCTLVAPCVLACRAGVFWREPRALTPPSWINRRAEVWNESIMYPREMETGSKERDGGGEGKSLAYERGSVRSERFSVIINRIVSTYARNVLRMIMKKHLLDV